MSSGETGFCINCGEEIRADAEICPECGSNQDPKQMQTDEESSGGSRFTSWAPGFNSGSTFRNIAIGTAYVLFLPIGGFILAYGYLKENPESGSTLAWILGILLILAGFGSLTDGTARGIIGGVIAVLLGIVVLPIVRNNIGVGNPPPGINQGNTARRNALVSVGYGVGAMIIAGAAFPETESSDSPSGGGTSGTDGGTSSTDGGTSGTDGGTSSTDGGTSGTDGESTESYPNAYYYDEATGIVLEDGVSAEADSIGSLYIRGTARNESGQNYDYVQISFSVLDSSGAKVADALANTSGLGEGQSWRYEALAASADNADSYQIQDITAY